MGERSNKRMIKAVVVSNKMDKTIVVRAQRLVKHPVFQKYVRNYVKLPRKIINSFISNISPLTMQVVNKPL